MTPAFISLVISMIVSVYTASNLVITDESSIVCSDINSMYGCTNSTINCPIDETCTIDCDTGCINVVIRAATSLYLTITNCNANHDVNYCTNMMIYIPRNGAIFIGNGSITNSTIYTKELFNDFTMSTHLTMVNTEIYCDYIRCDNQTKPVIEDVSVTKSHNNGIATIGVIIWSLIFIGIVLFCFYWIRQEIYHKNRPKSNSPVLSHPLLFKSRNTYTETVSSVEAGTSYSCDTVIFRTSQSMPILINDEQNTLKNDHDIHDDQADEVDLEYPQNENHDLLVSEEDNDIDPKLNYDGFIMIGDDNEKESKSWNII